MNIIYRILCVVFGYAFGLIQTAYLIGRSKHVDIRQYGSGNSGSTNALRTLGVSAGIITFLSDGVKAIVATLLVRLIFHSSDAVLAYVLYTGIGVVLGHNFPFYMHFKGGKGIAASAGVIVSCLDWKLVLIGLVTFALVAAITRYVSLASLCVMTGFLIELIVFGETGLLSPSSGFNPAYKIEIYILAACMTALAFFMHRENIVRLIHGNERKIGEKEENIS